jgi:hypothetical protein
MGSGKIISTPVFWFFELMFDWLIFLRSLPLTRSYTASSPLGRDVGFYLCLNSLYILCSCLIGGFRVVIDTSFECFRLEALNTTSLPTESNLLHVTPKRTHYGLFRLS